jgi:regulatory protein
MNENEADAARKWCSAQERCTQDARERLRRRGVPPEEVEQLVALLVEEDYLNETRFAESFVRARAEHKAWGPAKIRAGLRAKAVDSAVIEQAMSVQREEVFSEGLERLVARRANELPEGRDRVVRWLLGRGFGLGEVFAALARWERPE